MSSPDVQPASVEAQQPVVRHGYLLVLLAAILALVLALR
jgi:hypothetical protein